MLHAITNVCTCLQMFAHANVCKCLHMFSKCACVRARVRVCVCVSVRLSHTKVQMEIKISELESRLLSTDTKLLEEKAVTEMLKQELHRVLKEHEVVHSQGMHACMHACVHACVCVRARKRFCA